MTDRSSKKQRELLLFIDTFIKGNGYGPSYREIMRALGYKSVSTVAVHVDGLIQKGYLRKKDNSARSIEVVTLRDDTEPLAKEKAPQLVAQLEVEIKNRIDHRREGDEKDLQTLIDAARILGSHEVEVLQTRLDESRNS
jgi:repressor LexA